MSAIATGLAKPTSMQLIDDVWRYYEAHGRHDMPWRQPDHTGFDPYKIMVSEIMLQQTQVARVIPKYHQFLQRFPDVAALANAQLADVLQQWSGLGYNRRAKFLHMAAQQIVAQYGVFPQAKTDLVALPGIGPNTAGAIRVYAFDAPEVFIETNIRTVFIHYFFPGQEAVTDAQLLPHITQAVQELDNQRQTPRTWYWALMDYGSHIKQQEGNVSRRSKVFTRQSTFNGSRRQIRGQILKLLAAQQYSLATFQTVITDERLQSVLNDLISEGLISYQNKQYHLGSPT